MLDCKKVRAARLAKGLRQTFVSEKIGVSQAHYCNIENGRENPSLPTLEAITAVLGGSVSDYLIPDANPMIPRKVAARRQRPRESGAAVV
ncbi:MAG: helix-turn-helix transcriptional regulator [Cloacibacillus sp.]